MNSAQHTTIEVTKKGLFANSLGERELKVGDIVTASGSRGVRQVTITEVVYAERRANGTIQTLANCK